MAVNAPDKNQNEKILINDIRKKVTFSIVESYKNIRTNITAMMAKNNSKIVAISSPNAAEGKSTTALNIAITVSQLEKKVLIIDADTHRPTIHKKLKIENNFGLLNVILDKSGLDKALYHHNDYLDVLTCGANSTKPSELLNSEKFSELLNHLRDQYDFIIVDTPPINPVSDALVVAQKVDAVVLIVRAYNTTHDAFKKSLKSLNVLDIKVDGVIVNGSDPRPKGYYKSKYSYYKYGYGRSYY